MLAPYLDTLISTKDASKLYGYTPDYIARLARRGEIRASRPGRVLLIDRESLKQFVVDQNARKDAKARERASKYKEEYERAFESPRCESVSDILPATASSLVLAVVAALFVVASAFWTAQSLSLSSLTPRIEAIAYTFPYAVGEYIQSSTAYLASRIDFTSLAAVTDGVRIIDNGERMTARAAKTLSDIGLTVVDAKRSIIDGYEMIVYGFVTTSPDTARRIVLSVGGLGEVLFRVAERSPAAAARLFSLTTAIPARIAPAMAASVWGYEYSTASYFTALSNDLFGQYLATIQTAGSLAFEIKENLSAMMRAPSPQLAAAIIPTANDIPLPATEEIPDAVAAAIAQEIDVAETASAPPEPAPSSDSQLGAAFLAKVQPDTIAIAKTYIISDDAALSGDLVSFDQTTQTFRLAQEAGDPNVLGVVVTDPMIVLDTNPGGVPVVSTGTVTVNVTNANGTISVGDYITSSAVPGKAQKADTSDSFVIGTALDSFPSGTIATEELSGLAEDSGSIRAQLALGPPVLDETATETEQLVTVGEDIGITAPVAVLIKYLLAAMVVFGTIFIAFRNFGSNLKDSIVSIGRNPLAKASIQSMVVLNTVLIILVSIAGLFLGLLILFFPL
ncbi:hypothetical protein A2678_01415 [Candidatus Kaiserbacteria bacterium RIFCSPHIGHO2_01_FULL_53_31]|uniref:Helix-turn-helix domain-containing protein n=1 Tax=Candidatus Kaiserbacteria bacterium RIFCSPHIGHO2_01_FULL_53_31 TaxID=1798481 RepID=A0A1F6CG33_9BACT|nr:MAG: hypothetical protein A2678_01415 [Candidatus Kaiserbacteria bacterium RIFCSPHIGHO2_01_FULL_53_31]